MATDVVMPQMGESIAEGTIVRWIKKVGEKVDRDEPLFEISTDKVDAEIPAPVAGVVTEIRVNEGETVPVNSVVAVIGAANGAPTARPAAPAKAAEGPAKAAEGLAKAAEGLAKAAEGPAKAAEGPAKAGHYHEGQAAKEPTAEEAIHQRSSPLVRKLAKEHNVDISQIHGTGISGRVTRDDILRYIERQEGREGQVVPAARPSAPPRPAAAPQASKPAAPPLSKATAGQAGRTERMSVMRKKIAEHMVASRRTSAHVHSVFDVNFSRVAQIRAAKKAEYERAGAKLTYLSFIVKAIVDALGEMPVINASVDGENIVYHKEINVGIAVALDPGLIVPVIKQADEKNLLDLSRAIADLADRARSKQLSPDDVAGGTFTITNPGVFGALFGTPIINQPQVAILGVGNIEKRPVVIGDAIAIRPMAYLTLGYDHRLIDGAVADQFMSLVKHALENWDPAGA